MRRVEPRDDFLSALASAEDNGERLTEDELVYNCMLLLVAGNETTTDLIGNGMLSLIQHPEQMRRLQQDPSLLPSAIDELIRFCGPVHIGSRIASQDIEFHRRQIKRGQEVLVVGAAANRDPDHFPDPDRFDVGRTNNRHVGFGHGIHTCIGPPLAKVEAEVAVSTLLRRLPDPELLEEPRWNESFVFRGLQRLPLRSRSGMTA